MPGDYDSFATVILSQNYREINIAESLSVSIKVIIEGFFPIMMSWTLWLPVEDEENSHLGALGGSVSLQI